MVVDIRRFAPLSHGIVIEFDGFATLVRNRLDAAKTKNCRTKSGTMMDDDG